MKSVTITKKGIIGTVDCRTELLGVIMCLSDYSKYNDTFSDEYNNKFYIERIRKRFAPYKKDPVIKEFNTIVKTYGFVYDRPLQLFLELDEHFKCTKLSDYIMQIVNNNKKIYGFIAKLAPFAEKIGFADYYNSNLTEYKKYASSVIKPLLDAHLQDYLEDFYGVKLPKKIYVNCIPYTVNGYYGLQFPDKLVECISTLYTSDSHNLFDETPNQEDFTVIAVHELSHTIVNPLTAEYNLVTNDSNLFSDINLKSSLTKCYTGDITFLNEHIVRGCECLFVKNHLHDQAFYEKRVNHYQNDLGFKYLTTVIESLEYYLANRSQYQTFKEYYPNIIESINKAKKTSQGK